MHEHSDLLTRLFGGFTAVAAVLGISTQDLAYIVFGFIGMLCTVASFVCQSWNEHKKTRANEREERARTEIIREYIEEARRLHTENHSAALDVVEEATKRANRK